MLSLSSESFAFSLRNSHISEFSNFLKSSLFFSSSATRSTLYNIFLSAGSGKLWRKFFASYNNASWNIAIFLT